MDQNARSHVPTQDRRVHFHSASSRGLPRAARVSASIQNVFRALKRRGSDEVGRCPAARSGCLPQDFVLLGGQTQVTTFNFKGLAVRIADQLFKPKTYDVKLQLDAHSTSTVRMTAAQLQNLGPIEGDESVVTSVTPNIEEFPMEVLSELKLAVRYGGGEFLNQILEYCEGLTAAKRSDLPSPIDPLSP